MRTLRPKPFSLFLPLTAIFGAALIAARPLVAQPLLRCEPKPVTGTPIDVTALLASGEAQVSGAPGDIGTPANVFRNRLFRSAKVNPATITLAFAHDIEVSGFRVLFSNAEGNPAHQWQIEAATTEDIAAGRYRIIQPWVDVPQYEPSARQLKCPMTVRWLRLRVQRVTGDDYVHIQSWQLLAPSFQDTPPPATAPTVTPTAFSPAVLEAKSGSGGETEGAVKPQTASPTPEAKTITELQAGEIALRGTIAAVNANCLTLSVTAFRLPNSRESKLVAPKAKTIFLTPQTAWPGGALSNLQIGAPVEVIGPDAGSGKALVARVVRVCL